MSLIKYTNVELRQEEQIVLHDVNLSVEEGEFYYLLGRVGSGKSTFLKSLYAELPISKGEAEIFGYDLDHLRRRDIPYLRRKLGIVFQDFQLLNDRSVHDNLAFVLRSTGWKDRGAIDYQIDRVLEQVGMKTKGYKMPHEISGGEQQRVVIARALLNTPKLILADEPTGNLDPETGQEVMDLLHSIRSAGCSILCATHNLQWIDQYPGKCLYFENGMVRQG